MDLRVIGARAKEAASYLNSLGITEKNEGLRQAAQALLDGEEDILTANQEDVIRGRLQKAREEYREIPNYDYLVVNDKVSAAAAEIIAILTAEGCRTKNRMNLVEGV